MKTNRQTKLNLGMLLLIVALLISGCGKKKAEDYIQDGLKAEMKGQFDEAKTAYAEAASLGNAEAFKRMGDILVLHDFASLVGRDNSDETIAQMNQLLEQADDMFSKAQQFGYSDSFESSRNKLKENKAVVSSRIAELKEKKELAERERKQEEARREEQRKREEAQREEQRKREEAQREEERKQEEARQAERRRQEEERRLLLEKEREEQARRDSPQYCIDNGQELTATAFKQVVREMNFRSNTGNKVYDQKVMDEHHAIFKGQRIIVTGKILQVKGRLLSGIKVKMNCHGHTVWAICKSMSDDEGASLVVGRTIKIEGTVSSAILADINLDNAMPVD